MTLPPRVIRLRLLWAFAMRALSTSLQAAARIPLTLFAAIAMPIPVPQSKTPHSAFPSETARATFSAISG